MADHTNLKSCQLSNLFENMVRLMNLHKKSATAPSVISLSDPEVVAVDGDELKHVDQFHGDVLEKPWELISCGNKLSRNASIEQEVSRCQTSDTLAIAEDENNPDYTRRNDRIIKYSSTDRRCGMPEHLLFDILLWLPVITLLRFKSICKSWYALIGSSIFIAQHFDHNCGKDNLLGFPYYEDGNFDGYKCCLLSGNKYEVCNNFDHGQFGSVVDNSFVSLVFSSDGIIGLVYSDNQDVTLWNPAMKQVRPLPKSSVSFQSYIDIIFFGFGYSVKSNDYKVVRIFVREENMHNNVVEVYSLRADSWRTILKDVALPLWSLKRPISKNGTCFWISYADGFNPSDCILLSFDLNDDTFGTMPLPGRNVSFTASLDFLGDKLAYIYGLEYPEFSNGPRYYEIWVLHEYGVKESWRKVWNIGPTDIPFSHNLLFPYGFSKNGECLLLTDGKNLHGGSLYKCNLGTEGNEYFEPQQPNRFRLYVRYSESLVLVKRANDDILNY